MQKGQIKWKNYLTIQSVRNAIGKKTYRMVTIDEEQEGEEYYADDEEYTGEEDGEEY